MIPLSEIEKWTPFLPPPPFSALFRHGGRHRRPPSYVLTPSDIATTGSRTNPFSPQVSAHIACLLRRACVPLLRMLREWVTAGQLNDPHAEFFIEQRPAALADMWEKRYGEAGGLSGGRGRG
jgi:hypothetical protein